MQLSTRIKDLLEPYHRRNLSLPSAVREQVINAEHGARAVVTQYRDAVEAHIHAERNSPHGLNTGSVCDEVFAAATAAKTAALASIDGAVAALQQTMSASDMRGAAHRLLAARLVIEGARAAAQTARSYRNDLRASLRVFDEHVVRNEKAVAHLQQSRLPQVQADWQGDRYVRLTMSPKELGAAVAAIRGMRDALAAQLEAKQPGEAGAAFAAIRHSDNDLAWQCQMSPESIRSRRDAGAQHPVRFQAPPPASGSELFERVLSINYASSGDWLTLSAHDSRFGQELLARVAEMAGIPGPSAAG